MAADIKENKRWLCPTDRELTLRSKLNVGWSVHTQDSHRKLEPILEAELRSIETVIKRANAANYIEKERIRKMMCRFENMRTNSIGNGKNTCSMCGVSAGWFRKGFILCSDCSMAVCEKCRIDIHDYFLECVLCKICSENRELWKKSGGWFYGILPSVEILNCSELKCFQSSSSETWEHRAKDIVRLESYEAPEKTRSDPFYKTWAISSSPDITSIEEETAFKKYEKNKHRKSTDGVYLKKPMLQVPISKQMSTSCPALQNILEEEINFPAKKSKRTILKRKLLKPARKLVGKIKKH